MVRVVALAAALLIGGSPTQAQSGLVSVLSLDSAIATATGASPARAAADAALRAAAAGQTVAGLRPNPELGISVENAAGPAPYRRFDSAETTVVIAWPIELGGKRKARLAVAGAQADRARIDAAVAQADLRQQVAQAYVNALAAERRVLIAQAQAHIAGETAAAARRRVDAGTVSPIDRQRADLVRINAESELQKLARLAAVTRAHLGRLLGRPVDEPLDVAWFHRIPPAGPPRPIAIDYTLELSAARADTRTADAQRDLARSQRVPDIAINAGARRLAQSNDTVAVFGLAIPLPVRASGRAAVAQATAERDRTEAQQLVARLRTAQAVAEAQAEAANAALTAQTANGPAFHVASESARIARASYREGKLDQIALLDAEASLNRTRMDAIDALAAYHIARANLDRLTTSGPGD